MKRYTDVVSFEELIEVGGFTVRTPEEFEANPEADWDAHIAQVTRFPNWEAMLKKGGTEWLTRQVGLETCPPSPICNVASRPRVPCKRRAPTAWLARISHTVTAEGRSGSVGAEFLPREQVEQEQAALRPCFREARVAGTAA